MAILGAIIGCNREHSPNECPRVCTAWSLTDAQRTERWGGKSLPDEYEWGSTYDAVGIGAFKDCAEEAERKAMTFSRRACSHHYHRACVKACTDDLRDD